MVSWLSIALGIWWIAGGEPQEPAHLLWTEGSVTATGSAGLDLPIRTGGLLFPKSIDVGPQGLVWLLDKEGGIHGLRGPGRYGFGEQQEGDAGTDKAETPPRIVPLDDTTPSVIVRKERFDVSDDPLAGLVVHHQDTPGAIQVGATPRDTAIVVDRPRLQWPVVPNQVFNLVLEARGDDGANFVIERWQGLRLGYLRPQTEIQPGRWYRWTLSRQPNEPWDAATSMTPFGPSLAQVGLAGIRAAGEGEARATATTGYWFRVMPKERRAQLSTEIARCDTLQDSPDGIGPAAAVLRGILLERAGLFQAAEDAWRALATAHPNDEGISERLSAVTYRSLQPPQAPSQWWPWFISLL